MQKNHLAELIVVEITHLIIHHFDRSLPLHTVLFQRSTAW